MENRCKCINKADSDGREFCKAPRGSLSVEAAIITWVMSLLAVFVFSLFRIAALDARFSHAVAQTAGEVAAHGRIIGLMNELEDEGVFLKGFESLTIPLKEVAGKAMTEKIFLEKLKEAGLPDNGNFRIARCQLPGNDTLKDDLPDPGNISTDPGDVLITAEWELNLHFPLFRKGNLILRHTSVEKAWVAGRVHLFPLLVTALLEDDQAKNDPDRIVYITRTGTRYHGAGCRYLAKSCIAVRLSKAVQQGYIRCLICRGGLPVLAE
ncbi:MAG TPA: hypothetical protein DD727_09740 [Clostridiales bacterium]|nr:hypothetical protein [Clostridiales bacterium]